MTILKRLALAAALLLVPACTDEDATRSTLLSLYLLGGVWMWVSLDWYNDTAAHEVPTRIKRLFSVLWPLLVVILLIYLSWKLARLVLSKLSWCRLFGHRWLPPFLSGKGWLCLNCGKT